MEFGKVDKSTLDEIDFSLPHDGKFIDLLPEQNNPPKIYLGAPKWGIKEWIGLIYPEKTKETQFLDHYIQSFSGIELNTTHYQIYPESTIRKWAKKANGKDFLFCPKFPQSISHYSELTSVRAHEITDRFLSSIIHFEEHLGPLFLQLSDKYGPNKKTALFDYLERLPRDLDITLEVRHPDWYQLPHRETLFEKLFELGIGSVITDVSGRRDCAHMEVTSPVTLIRFVGNGLHPTDYKRIDEWVERIGLWMKKGLKAIHFYVHQPGELYTPELTEYLAEQLNSKLGLALEGPKFIVKSGSLF
jgi:uncharacterized protein YecE (DUF72 family)